MDPISMAGAARAATSVVREVNATGLPARLFGKVLDSVGDALDDEFRDWNIQRITRKAARRARLEDPKIVNARVAYRILQDGSFCNDDVTQEYLAGLVAGSYSDDGGDDRASYYVDLVAKLPGAQVRLHHAIYSAFASAGPKPTDVTETDFKQRALFTPLEDAAVILQHSEEIKPRDAVEEALAGLEREGLIAAFGVADSPQDGYDKLDGWMVGVLPSQVGTMLALWAHGIRDANADRLHETTPCDFEAPGPTFGHSRLRIGHRVMQAVMRPVLDGRVPG